MQYFGGKQRIADEIAPIIQLLRGDRPYFEPFVGGANVVTRITGGVRIAADVVPELIALYRALQEGWTPPRSLTKDEYRAIKADPTPTPLRGFAAFGCSFAGKYFGGYAGKDSRSTRCYATNAANGLEKKRVGLMGCALMCGDYRTFTPKGCLIYCDPPYRGTTAYAGAGKFNSDEFWGRCREWAKNNVVLVSEYDAPVDCTVVCWEKEVRTEIRGKEGRLPRIERLYQVIPEDIDNV